MHKFAFRLLLVPVYVQHFDTSPISIIMTQTDIYSWWSYRFQARQKNIGWRIDYFVVSDDLKPRLKDAKIHTEIFGSDHCPVELTLE